MIRLLGPGDIAGYRALIANEPFAATAEALERTTVCTFPRNVIHDLLRNDPDLSFGMMAKLARELRVSEDEMVARLSESVTQRTARLLLGLAEERGARGGSHLTLELPVRREDLARMIGTTPESLSRALHGLARRGILDVDRRTVRIRNLLSLRKLLGRAS
jgi:CRP-like cAMP-binding protein